MKVRLRDIPTVESRRVATGEVLGALRDVSEVAGLRHLRFHYEVLAVGRRSSPSHRHTTREEVVFVIQGTPTLLEGGERTLLQPNEIAVFLPDEGLMHSIVNESDAEVHLLVASAADMDDQIIFPEDV